MGNLIQLRRGTTEQWVFANPILQAGEPGYETNTRRIKLGNGVDRWGDLLYMEADAAGVSWLAVTGKPLVFPPDVSNVSFQNYISGQVSSHNLSTSVHGISNTSQLVYTTDSRLSDSRTPVAHNHSASEIVSGVLADSLISENIARTSLVTSAINGHSSATQNIHGISDTSSLVYTTDPRLTDSRTPVAHAASHASGGADAISPANIGAQPAGNYATLIAGVIPASQLPSLSTTNVTEGSRLYYTDARAQSAALNLAGTGNLTLCAGNDPRLSDARDPTAHTHDASAINSGVLSDARLSDNVAFTPAVEAIANNLALKADLTGDVFTGQVIAKSLHATPTENITSNPGTLYALQALLNTDVLQSNVTFYRGLSVQPMAGNETSSVGTVYGVFAGINSEAGKTRWNFYTAGTAPSYMGYSQFFLGSAASPSLSFVTDEDTGLYRGAADEIAVSCGGVEACRFRANRTIRFLPQASAPSAPLAGDVYFNGTSLTLNVYNGTQWVSLH